MGNKKCYGSPGEKAIGFAGEVKGSIAEEVTFVLSSGESSSYKGEGGLEKKDVLERGV